jgi:hypothetical protein
MSDRTSEDDRTTVALPGERGTFWEGAAQSMKESAYSDFYGREFVSDDQAHLVVVHEDC